MTEHATNYVWGQDVLAPVNGKVGRVMSVLDDQPDQTPGTPLAQSDPGSLVTLQPAGNHVVILTAEGEFVFLAHMQRGSVRAYVGDSIKTREKSG